MSGGSRSATLDWLPGYEGSAPVRVGNAASTQLQLDVYGEVLDALYQARAHGAPADDHIWSLARNLLAWLEENWRREDSGIWEVRGPARHFTHSKVMAWVAFDRGVRACEDFGREGPVDRWRAIRDEIKDEVLARGWSDAKQSFTQSYGSDALDASALVIPIVGFLPRRIRGSSPRSRRLERELLVDGLVLRYRPEDEGVDGLPGGEGVFLAVLVLARRGARAPGPAGRGDARCSSGCSRCGTTSACSPRSTTRARDASSGTSPRRSRTSRSSRRRSRSARVAGSARGRSAGRGDVRRLRHDGHMPSPGEATQSSRTRSGSADVRLQLARREGPVGRGDRGKARARGVAADAAAAAIEEAIRLGYLDDAELAGQLARGFKARGYGRRRAAQTLRRRGLPEAVADAALEAAFGDEDEDALAARALGQRAVDDDGARRRAVSFLVRRGFSPAAAWRVVQHARSP